MRLEKMRAYKFSNPSGKSSNFKDYPRRVGLYAEWLVAEHRLKQGCEASRSTPSK